VITGESWAEAIARPLLFGDNGYFVSFYFVSFICLLQVILLNVFVAVLLEKFLGAEEAEEEWSLEGEDLLALITDHGNNASGHSQLAYAAGVLGAASSAPTLNHSPSPSPSAFQDDERSQHGQAESIHAKLDRLLQRDELLVRQLELLQKQVETLMAQQRDGVISSNPLARLFSTPQRQTSDEVTV
jgi:hypothetical protein